MKVVLDFLSKSEHQYLATVGLDGKPKVRPFQFMMEHQEKLYFCTSNNKEVYKEIQKQPDVELCASGDNMSWLRLSGTVIFTQDTTLKQMVLDANTLVKAIYKTPDNPILEVFYLDEVTATIADFSGEPPHVFKL